MSNENNAVETKICKKCATEIPKKAKICPNCRKKQGMGLLSKIIIGVLVLFVAVSIMSGNDDSSATTNNSEIANKELIVVNIGDMMKDLDENALNAKEKYKDKYIEVSGAVSNIDSDGKYFNIVDPSETLTFDSIQIYTNNDNKNMLSSLSKDKVVTVKGVITDVGEVLGYSMDLESVE